MHTAGEFQNRTKQLSSALASFRLWTSPANDEFLIEYYSSDWFQGETVQPDVHLSEFMNTIQHGSGVEWSNRLIVRYVHI